jgi:hypothetical protein
LPAATSKAANRDEVPIRLRRRLEEALRGRKVGLLVHRSREPAPPIVEIARETGVRL